MVSAAAIGIHSIMNPNIGTPNTTAKASKAVDSGGGTALSAAVPSAPAAVMDCPTGPSTIHSVGTLAEPELPKWASLLQISVMMMIEVTRLIPKHA